MKRGRKSAWDTKIKHRLEEIAGWCREGLTEIEISKKLDVSIATIAKYKIENTQFSDILKTNKEYVDNQVEATLLQKALGGQEYEEVVEEYYLDTRKIDPKNKKAKPDKIHRKIVKKVTQPDTTALIFWIKNRRPRQWRDKIHTEVSGDPEKPIKYTIEFVKPTNAAHKIPDKTTIPDPDAEEI